MMPKNKILPRGYKFSNFVGQAEGKLVQIVPPASVTIPLKQGFGNEVAPLVELDQKVSAGEIIGRDDESVSSPVHSSVNGKVTAIETIDHLGRETAAVVIESDGNRDWQSLDGFSADYENLSAEKIGELIYLSGAGSSGKAGIPTGFNSSVIPPQEVKNVVIQGLDSQMHNISLDVLLNDNGLHNKDDGLHHFVEGLKILKKLMAGAQFHLALNKSDKDLTVKLSHLLQSNDWIEIHAIAAKYPFGRDEVLTPMLTGNEFPHGYSAANVGVIVLDVQAVLHVYDAVAKGKPVIERTLALCGPGFKENFHVKARIGSDLECIIADNIVTDKSLRFVSNNALSGEQLSDMSLPIDRTSTIVLALFEETESEFLAFARPGADRDSYSRTFLSLLVPKNSKLFQKKCGTNVHGELRPCISCTFCEEVCPTGIIPHLLFHYVERDVIDENLLKYKIGNCIECNLCSYVCPSKIPVAQFIKEGKAKLLEEGFKPPVPSIALTGVEKYKSIK
jgi:Na(+)-translocating NADH:ubiquinone oxidoreductase A subunit